MSETRSRALATIEQIVSVSPIPKADSIVRARVRGWDVVVKLGAFAVGDLCVYFEIDSFLDVTDHRFGFLNEHVKTDSQGRRGHALRTRKMRGQYSQGLVLPLSEFPELGEITADRIGEDVTTALHVLQWDPPIPAEMTGKIHGYRPGWISGTDQDRVQNIAEILAAGAGLTWIATEKIDGTSTSFWVDEIDGGHGVCMRNIDLVEDPNLREWRLAHQLKIHHLLRQNFPGRRSAVQGESYGRGAPFNPLDLDTFRFAAFNVIVDGASLPRAQWPDWVLEMSVPTHDLDFPATVEKALEQVDDLRSKINPARLAEGIVWRAADITSLELETGAMAAGSFKVISNRYLHKNDN